LVVLTCGPHGKWFMVFMGAQNGGRVLIYAPRRAHAVCPTRENWFVGCLTMMASNCFALPTKPQPATRVPKPA